MKRKSGFESSKADKKADRGGMKEGGKRDIRMDSAAIQNMRAAAMSRKRGRKG